MAHLVLVLVHFVMVMYKERKGRFVSDTWVYFKVACRGLV